jgi:hypothetical protein
MNVRPPPAAWTAPSPDTGKLIALEGAELLCIENGRGMCVRALSGMLWITEADSSADHMLRPGDEIRLARPGTAIVSAVRPARLVIELGAPSACPDAVEKVRADGQRTRIALGRPTRGAVASFAGAIAPALANALAAIEALAKRFGAGRYSPMTYPDAYLPRHRRRRAKHATRGVDRAVIDQWLMWRK